MTDSNIRHVAPLLAHYFVEHKIDEVYHRNYRQMLKDKKVFLDDFVLLMGGRLHDSWITDIITSEYSCKLMLSDFVTHVFAQALVELKCLSIEESQLLFPIYVDFELTSGPEYYSINEDGKLTDIPPIVLTEYLDEQILNFKSSRKLGILASSDGSDKVLVVLNLKLVKVKFEQDEAWYKLFGSQYDMFYDRFKELLRRGKYLADQSICEELLTKWLCK